MAPNYTGNATATGQPMRPAPRPGRKNGGRINRSKVAQAVARVANAAAIECRGKLADVDGVTDEQRAFLEEMAAFNATNNFPRSAAQRVIRKQQARRMETRAKALFPGIPVEVV